MSDEERRKRYLKPRDPGRAPERKPTKEESEQFLFLGSYYGKREVYSTLIVILVAAAMIGYWLYDRDYYTEMHADTVLIAGNEYPVAGFRGIEAWNDPGKMRACFEISVQVFAPPAENPQPRAAPGWFKCFYPDRIIEELAAGKAKMYMAEYNNPPGYDRVVVIYENSRSDTRRAYMWQQPNDNYVE